MSSYPPVFVTPPDDAYRLVEQEHEEFCLRAALSIAGDIERGGLAEINGKLAGHGYKIIRLSDVVPV